MPRLPSLTLVFALAFALLAGCADPDPGLAPAATASPAPPTETFSAPAMAAANGTEGTLASAFTMDGQTPAGACAFAIVVGDCRFTGGDGSQHALESDGTPLLVRGTLRWTGTLPTSVGDPLDLEILVLHDDGSGWRFGQGDPYASGPSPLEFQLPLTALHGRMALQVSQSVGLPLPVGYVGVMTPHGFHLEGELLSQPS
jgi:hypothetical protein